jgi:hypothetical protein
LPPWRIFPASAPEGRAITEAVTVGFVRSGAAEKVLGFEVTELNAAHATAAAERNAASAKTARPRRLTGSSPPA